MSRPFLSLLMVAPNAEAATPVVASAARLEAECGMEVLVHLPAATGAGLGASSVTVVEMRSSAGRAESLDRLVRAARGRMLALCRPGAFLDDGDWAGALARFEAAFPDRIAALRPAGGGGVLVATEAVRDHPMINGDEDPIAAVEEAMSLLGRRVDAPDLRIAISIPTPSGSGTAAAARRLADSLLADPALRAAMAVHDLERYVPPSAISDEPWPPRHPCRGWNGRNAPEAIHYSRINTLAVMSEMIRSGFTGGEVFLSRTMSGLPNLLWTPLFDRVRSVDPVHGKRPVRIDGKHIIHYGLIHDDRFIHPVVDAVRDLTAIVLDDRRYDELCCGYFLFKRVLKRPGIVVFIHATGGEADRGPARFLADLARGYLDNRHHDIVFVDNDVQGRGMAYEIIA